MTCHIRALLILVGESVLANLMGRPGAGSVSHINTLSPGKIGKKIKKIRSYVINCVFIENFYRTYFNLTVFSSH